MGNKKIFVRDIKLFFFSVYRIAHRTIIKKIGPTQYINSLRIAKRHKMTLKLYIHPHSDILDRDNLLEYRYNRILDRFNGTADPYNGLEDHYNEILDRYIVEQ